jgi:hypothetical protein
MITYPLTLVRAKSSSYCLSVQSPPATAKFRHRLASGLFLFCLLQASGAAGASSGSIPFLDAEFSVFHVNASSSALRQFNFVMPDIYLSEYYLGAPEMLAPCLDPTSAYVLQDIFPFALTRGTWNSASASPRFTVGCADGSTANGFASTGLDITAQMFIMQEPDLKSELQNRILPVWQSDAFVASDFSFKDVTLNYRIQGGPFAGQTVPLHGQMVYGSKTNVVSNPDAQDGWIGEMLIALNWGVDPLGNTEYFLLTAVFAVGASTSDPDCLPLQDACNTTLGTSTVKSYFTPEWNAFMAQVDDTNKMYLSGAVPELLYLYDFSGLNTLPPSATLPAGSLALSTVLAPLNQLPPGYTNVYKTINQYDAGLAFNLPARDQVPGTTKGGNACGPTSLGMMLYGYGISPVDPGSVFDNTTQLGLFAPTTVGNGFDWYRALSWLKSGRGYTFSSPSPLPGRTAVYQREVTGDNVTGSEFSTLWQSIDALLSQKQPVEIRTDLGGGTSPGGGHCILLLGRGHNAELAALYGQGTRGDYYIAADPAGHYYGNSSGTHYGACLQLAQKNVGINYGGWYAIYPKELLQQRSQDISTDVSYKYRMEALTIGSPFVSPSAAVTVHSPVAVIVTDPIGRQTGLRPDGTVVKRIPFSLYEWAANDEEEQGTSSVDPDGPKRVEIDYPMDGVYHVELTGTNSGSYELDWVVLDRNGQVANALTNSGTTAVGQQTNYTFSVQLGGSPSLQFLSIGSTLALFWPTNAAGFALQSTTNLGNVSSWTTVAGPFSQTNGVFAITNTLSGHQQFYRLKRFSAQR